VTEEGDLFQARLDQIIYMKHGLVQVAAKLDWDWIDEQIVPLYSDKGRRGSRPGPSDEGVCERWVHDPYFQHFTGETFFQRAFPHERSDLSHWRKRLGDRLELLLAESLHMAHDTGALRPRDLRRVTVGTTVQPKAITFPTDAKLLHGYRRARPARSQTRRTAAAVVPTHRQASCDDGWTLCRRQAIQSAVISNCAC